MTASSPTFRNAKPSEATLYAGYRPLHSRSARSTGNIRSRLNAETEGLCLSTIVLTELLHAESKPAHPVEKRTEVERFASRLVVPPFDTDAAVHAGESRATLEREGRQIGGFDVLIAGHARSRSLVVMTGNLGEFNRADGLRSKDWRPTN